jgi:hypothetical protein
MHIQAGTYRMFPVNFPRSVRWPKDWQKSSNRHWTGAANTLCGGRQDFNGFSECQFATERKKSGTRACCVSEMIKSVWFWILETKASLFRHLTTQHEFFLRDSHVYFSSSLQTEAPTTFFQFPLIDNTDNLLTFGRVFSIQHLEQTSSE